MAPSTQTERRAKSAITAVYKTLPFAALALMVLIHVRGGIDIPYLDDWRDYAASTTGTYSPAYLFQPANDTLYPVGKLLDSIFLDALDGNTLLYQAISMILVLGAILCLTWKLLHSTLDDPLLAACAFIPTLLMLQIDSYWGRQYVAYHQAIPLICLLAILTITVTKSWRPAIQVAAIFLLGLIAGGAYISGAFAGIGVALVLIAAGLLRPHRRNVLTAGFALALASTMTAIAQAFVIIVVQNGQTHRPDTTWATPLSLDFWAFTLGKIGRSLALPQQYPAFSVVVAGLATAATALLVMQMIWRFAAGNHLDRMQEDRSILTVSLVVAVVVYLGLVAAGRTNMRPAEIDTPLEVFQIGFARFHFFWATAIWPWVVAALFTALDRKTPSLFPWIASTCAACLVVTVVNSGALNYRGAFAETAATKAQGLACMQEKLITADAIICPQLYPATLNVAYAEAVEVEAPFIHAVPPTLRRYNQQPKLLLLGADQLGPDRTIVKNAENVVWNGASVTLVATADPQIEFKVYRRRRMSECRMLDVAMRLTGAPGQTAQLYFLAPGATGFTEAQSRRIASDGQSAISFTLSSREGFADRLRLDPTEGAGKVNVSDLTVRCLLP